MEIKRIVIIVFVILVVLVIGIMGYNFLNKPNCIPSVEIQNNMDDNCNGYIDEGFSSAITSPNVYTWFDNINKNMIEFGIKIKIDSFPKGVPGEALYFWALVTSFSDSANIKNSWGHLGLQYTLSCGASDYKCANWGGGGDLSTGDYGFGGSKVINYSWKTGEWYSYVIKRTEANSDGTWNWKGYIYDKNNLMTDVGTVKGGEYIVGSPSVFSETGYGIRCDSPGIKVVWKEPYYLDNQGIKGDIPKAVGTYNDQASNCGTTNQELISKNEWFHQLNTKRITKDYGVLWEDSQ